MNILGTQYTPQTRSFEIYVSGCSGTPHCPGCHNPESWDFDLGDSYNSEYFKKIHSKIFEFDSIIDNVMILGGEPLDQNFSELLAMLLDLNGIGKPIWIFTRYDLADIPDFVKKYCSYIKCGRYESDLITDNNTAYNIRLATSNQKIYKKGLDY